jgi:hypothetical protein
MPKGKKTCPKCKAENGLRTQKCVCGHEFSKSVSLPNVASETVPIEKNISDVNKSSFSRRIIYAPVGDCPVKPKGYKNNKFEDSWTDEVVRNWAMDVYNFCGSYRPEAVIYFARFFWDINGPDFEKIRGLIVETLIPKKSHESEDESNEVQEIVTR